MDLESIPYTIMLDRTVRRPPSPHRREPCRPRSMHNGPLINQDGWTRMLPSDVGSGYRTSWVADIAADGEVRVIAGELFGEETLRMPELREAGVNVEIG